MARANTPDSVSFRRFLPFSPWRAPARLRLKNQKSLENPSLAGALQFCRSRNVPRQEKTRREYLPYCHRTETFLFRYHRLTRANTPDSASFRRFLPFSPCWASAQRRLKKQKSLENTSLPGAGSFVGAEMCPGKERPAENTAVLSRDLTRYGRISARQNRVCPCQSMVS